MHRTMIVSGRFQPLHLGHIQTWLAVTENHSAGLVICILRRSSQLETLRQVPPEPSTFGAYSRIAWALEKNPLPNWHRLRLVTLAVANEPRLALRTTIVLRARPDVSWDTSLEDLPLARTWIFHAGANFDTAKADYYRRRGEPVYEIEQARNTEYQGSVIRARLREGSRDFGFLPPACREYFEQECLTYFTGRKGG
jgi:nicotinic acid mononucleotide adenylyltransferase